MKSLNIESASRLVCVVYHIAIPLCSFVLGLDLIKTFINFDK